MQSTKRKVITLRVPQEDVDQLDQLAVILRTSREAIIREGIVYILQQKNELEA